MYNTYRLISFAKITRYLQGALYGVMLFKDNKYCHVHKELYGVRYYSIFENGLMRIVVGMSGASGAIYGVRLLQCLRATEMEVHLVISKAAELTLRHECSHIATIQQLQEKEFCDKYHDIADVGASIASGSFATEGMIVAPCSVRTMSEIASGTSSSLLTRAADVTLKERRKLVLMVRETPLHLGHLKTMTALTQMGAIIFPPVPSFYNHPQTIRDMVDHSVSRVMGIFGLRENTKEWKGMDNDESWKRS